MHSFGQLRRIAVTVVFSLWATHFADAAEFRRLDGIHRIEKRAPAPVPTAAAVLLERQDQDQAVCGTSMKMCPSSVDGGCCPDNFECARENCYATTRGTSSCDGRVGWYACDRLQGGGCCPNGYICEAGGCAPPPDVSASLECPVSFFACPASLSGGCCPNNMGCGVNQCYSTEPVTFQSTITVSTTEEGDRLTFTTTTVVVETPTARTWLPMGSGEDEGAVVKFYPATIAKATPMPTGISDSDDDDDNEGGSGSGGLSTGGLVGIIVAAIVLLIILLLVACFIIRRLNKVAAALEAKSSSDNKSRPQMRQFKPTDSEIDALSVDPLMMAPKGSSALKVTATRRGRSSPSDNTMAGTDPDTKKNKPHIRWPQSPDREQRWWGGAGPVSPPISLSEQTVTSFGGGGFQMVSPGSRHDSFDEGTGGGDGSHGGRVTSKVISYFDQLLARGQQQQQQQRSQEPNRESVRQSQQSTAELMGSSTYRQSSDSAGTHATAGAYGHLRHWSNASEGSAELDDTSYMPELMGSPTSYVSPLEEARRRSGGSLSSLMSRPVMAHHQRKRSDGGWSAGAAAAATGGGASGGNGSNVPGGSTAQPPLDVVNEEGSLGPIYDEGPGQMGARR